MKRRANVLLVALVALLTQCETAPVLEVSRFECRPEWSLFEAFGTVKNLSDQPLQLTANVSLDMQVDTESFSGDVKPRLLAPGAEGRFHIRDSIPALAGAMGGADCWLDPFHDASGRELGYSLTGSAAENKRDQ